MSVQLTTDQVWKEIENQFFAVLGTVNPKGEPRTAGIAYMVKDKSLYIGTSASSVKAKNVAENPHVSMTVTVDRRMPFLGWMKIPPAVITFRGEATLHRSETVDANIRKKLIDSLALSEEARANVVFIQVKPTGSFSTYGVGVSIRTMMRPDEAWGRVAV